MTKTTKAIALCAVGAAWAGLPPAAGAADAAAPESDRNCPLMGWSSWNAFGVDISEDVILDVARAMATNGLKAAGYRYVNIDDGFYAGHGADGRLRFHPVRFPNGMKRTVDGIHALGLKAGIYSDAGADTCGSMWAGSGTGGKDAAGVGSGLYGHDAADCRLHFNELGFDFIKVDYCGGKKLGLDERARYGEIARAIRATGRTDVRLNVCRWAYPGTWISEIADSWRTTADIRANWKSVRTLIAENLYLSAYASPGHYNDMDMLEVGQRTGGVSSIFGSHGDTGLTEDEEVTHFGMWCMMSSPLLVGCDARKVPAFTMALVTNPHLVAMDQNRGLGVQGYVAQRVAADAYVLAKDADVRFGTSRYVALYNAGDSNCVFDVRADALDLGGKVRTFDLVAQAPDAAFEGSLKVEVRPHASRFFRFDAETRLERTVYEAETAFLTDYQELKDPVKAGTAFPAPAAGASGGVAVRGLGGRPSNDLVWKEVRIESAGLRTLEFTCAGDEDLPMAVDVDGREVARPVVRAGRAFAPRASVTVRLEKGVHAVRLSNPTGRMPDVDLMRVTEPSPTAFVDPFVGTAGTGHTTPAACVPFGLVQAGPDSGWNDWAHCSGYQKGDPTFLGFSQTHLNGTGCPDLGDMRFLPYRGAVKRAAWTVRKDAASERAEPGYYAVDLPDERLRVEVAALARTAVYRLTPAEDMTLHLFFDQEGCIGDFARSRGTTFPAGFIRDDGDRAFDAFCRRNGWVRDRDVYARFAFSRPFAVAAEFPCAGKGNAVARRVYDFALRAGEPLEVRLALSATSCAAARRNLDAELADKGFDAVRAEASAAWARALAGAEVRGGTDEQKRNFYTALYHLYQQPNDLSDVGEPPRASTLSMWDVFRAACPWYALMKPEVIDGIVASALRQYDEVGYLPIWQLWGKDNHCMIGDHAVPVVVDAYLSGRPMDAEKAYRAVKDSLTKNFKARPKDRFDVLDRYGYYPFDLITGESVSRTLECAYDDACAARFAAALGKPADAAFFAKRAGNWKNVFDAETGFARGKDTRGKWREPFDPYELGHGAGSGNDFTEGNSFQYSWHVLHDVPGLVAAMGGREPFAKKLDALFAAPDKVVGKGCVVDVTGLIGQYAHGNEPSHHVAYLYPYVGRPDRTADVVREVFDRFYAPKPDGLCGNDDCGQMSAWYVFSALGFYPVDPASGAFVLGAPQLPQVRLGLPNGKAYTVTAKGLSKANRYVKSVTLDGRPFAGFQLKRADVLAGGELVFEMAPRP